MCADPLRLPGSLGLWAQLPYLEARIKRTSCTIHLVLPSLRSTHLYLYRFMEFSDILVCWAEAPLMFCLWVKGERESKYLTLLCYWHHSLRDFCVCLPSLVLFMFLLYPYLGLFLFVAPTLHSSLLLVWFTCLTLHPALPALSLCWLSDFLLYSKWETRVPVLIWECEPGTPNNFFGFLRWSCSQSQEIKTGCC